MMNEEQLLSIVNGLPQKGEDPNTTTRKFKYDLVKFFSPLGLSTCVEVSGLHGPTTYALSHCFNQVVHTEAPDSVFHPGYYAETLAIARKRLAERSNVVYVQLDAYKDKWPFRFVDTFVIDASHMYKSVLSDIANAKMCMKEGGYIAFDDYSLPFDNLGVRRAIHDSNLRIVQYIGELVEFNPNNVFEFKLGVGEPEGVIVQI